MTMERQSYLKEALMWPEADSLRLAGAGRVYGEMESCREEWESSYVMAPTATKPHAHLGVGPGGGIR